MPVGKVKTVLLKSGFADVVEVEKQKNSNAITVFVSPCAAKRKEGLDNPNINYVMNVQELNSFFDATKINVDECEKTPFEIESSKQGRNLPVMTGVEFG